ncbi:hypothetical protein C2845_PM13G05970 [Panicum miliaceum]|uniref:Uncharacterized protein n=1 Tax=Panicum miliaceum TaxID=4540 RepID=A0A3L6REN4_PANMI|nr:hypothetical protein C2845_PM13G05970 [Panicum miliaceum]
MVANPAPGLPPRTGLPPVLNDRWEEKLTEEETVEVEILLAELQKLKADKLTGASVVLSFAKRLAQPIYERVHPGYKYSSRKDPTRGQNRKVSRNEAYRRVMLIVSGEVREMGCPKAYCLKRPTIEHPPANSMASFNFTSTVLDKGTTFIFGSWICIANGSSGFDGHLADTKEPETSSCSSQLNEFIDSLDDMLLYLAREIEENSVPDAFSARVPTRLSSPGSTRTEEEHTRFPIGQLNAASTHMEALRSKSLSDLENKLDLLLEFGDEDATACWEAPVFSNYSNLDDDPDSSTASHIGLSITTTAQDRFVYWKGMEPSELLDGDARLGAIVHELPFQKGRPLSPIREEVSGSSTSTFPISHDYSTDYSPEVLMASLRDIGPLFLQ